jgi:purine-binding chemotaxis protein CheW
MRSPSDTSLAERGTARAEAEGPPPSWLAEFLAAEDEIGRAAARPDSAPTAARVELLVFGLGDESYALPVPSLREIVRPPPLSEVPRADPSVLGVTMLRGEVVPVYDPRSRLGLTGRPVPTSSSRVIIAQAAAGVLGLWVDRVRQVVRVPASQLEAPPRGVGDERLALVSLGRIGSTLFAVLDLGVLIGAAREAAR